MRTVQEVFCGHAFVRSSSPFGYSLRSAMHAARMRGLDRACRSPIAASCASLVAALGEPHARAARPFVAACIAERKLTPSVNHRCTVIILQARPQKNLDPARSHAQPSATVSSSPVWQSSHRFLASGGRVGCAASLQHLPPFPRKRASAWALRLRVFGYM